MAGEEIVIAKAGEPVARLVPDETPFDTHIFLLARYQIELIPLTPAIPKSGNTTSKQSGSSSSRAR